MAEPDPDPIEPPSSRGIVMSTVFIIIVMAAFVFEQTIGLSELNPFSGNRSNTEGLPEGSLQPAYAACKRAATVELSSALVSSYLDKVSTRYSAANQEYVVFLNVTIRNQEALDYYYECNVSAVTQEVTRTRLTGPPNTFQQIEF